MYDVAVIGAGLLGLNAAWHLARAGLSVAVFERKWVAGESSALGAGHVPQTSFERPRLDVLRRTRALVEDLDRRTGGMVRFTAGGGLTLFSSSDAGADLEDRVRLSEQWGAPAEMLSPAEVRQRWPRISTDGLAGAFFCPEDGFVRALDLTVTLGSMARLSGARIFEGSLVEPIDVSEGRVRGVVVGGETITAKKVLLAAGGWSAQIAAASGFSLPLKSFVLGAAILLDAPFALSFMSEPAAGYYTTTRNKDSLLLGLPSTDHGVGPDDFRRDLNPEDSRPTLKDFCRRVPSMKGVLPAGGWAGLLITSPDDNPLLGEYGGLEGLFLAVGMSGGGLQHVSVGEAVAAVMAGEPPFFDMSSWQASRF